MNGDGRWPKMVESPGWAVRFARGRMISLREKGCARSARPPGALALSRLMCDQAEVIEGEVEQRDVVGLGEFTTPNQIQRRRNTMPGRLDRFTDVGFARSGNRGVFGEEGVDAVVLARGI